MNDETKTPLPFPPAGYTELDLTPDSVDFDKTPLIQGEVVGLQSLNANGKLTRTMLIRDGINTLRVWEGAGLRNVFEEIKKGDHVAIQYVETRPLAGGRTMRVFKAAVKPAEQKETPF